jgi:hypothetical protein
MAKSGSEKGSIDTALLGRSRVIQFLTAWTKHIHGIIERSVREAYGKDWLSFAVYPGATTELHLVILGPLEEIREEGEEKNKTRKQTNIINTQTNKY